MKTNTKGKTVVPSKKASARKPGRGNNHASRASTDNKEKPAGKPSVKSPEKEKKSALSKKTAKKSLKVKKKLPAGPAPAAKKASVKKAPAGSPKINAEAAKKKAAPPKTKTVRKTATKISLPKASRTPKKSSQRRKVSSPVKGPKKKSTSRIKGKDELNTITRTQLPDEYGENELILMAVDPGVVFVDWEIKKEGAPEGKDGFTMRVFDVAGDESARLRRESFFDIKIEGRVGSGFFELGMPGREVAVEIGFFDKSKFLPILSSSVVLMPRLLVSDELGIAKKLFESGIPIGY